MVNTKVWSGCYRFACHMRHCPRATGLPAACDIARVSPFVSVCLLLSRSLSHPPRHRAIKKRCARGIAAPAPQMHTVLTFCIKDFICISETKCLVIHKLHSISSTPLKSTFWSTSSQDPVCDCTPMVQTPRVSRCRCSTPSLAPESHKGVVPRTPTLPTRLRSRGLPNRLSP